MSDERRVDTVRPQQLLFERQNDRRLGDDPRHGVEATRSPRPDLRRDVVQHRHANGVRVGGDAHVESRIVDEHDERRVAAAQTFPDLPL